LIFFVRRFTHHFVLVEPVYGFVYKEGQKAVSRRVKSRGYLMARANARLLS
jgi:hypothetical protein